MCRLCLPTTTLEQHFEYFKSSSMQPKDIVNMVLKSHKHSKKVNIVEEVEIVKIQDSILIDRKEYIEGVYRKVQKELEGPKNEMSK